MNKKLWIALGLVLGGAALAASGKKEEKGTGTDASAAGQTGRVGGAPPGYEGVIQTPPPGFSPEGMQIDPHGQMPTEPLTQAGSGNMRPSQTLQPMGGKTVRTATGPRVNLPAAGAGAPQGVRIPAAKTAGARTAAVTLATPARVFPLDSTVHQVHDYYRDQMLDISRGWPKFGQFLTYLQSVASVPPAIDPHAVRPELQSTAYEESSEDLATLRNGIAVRFHPSMFYRSMSTLQGAGEPHPERKNQIHLDPDGRWWIWNRNEKEFQPAGLAPPHYYMMNWDVLFDPQTGQPSPVYRRVMSMEEELVYLKGEQAKASADPNYIPQGVPIYKDGRRTKDYNPDDFLTHDEAFPLGLAAGDSDRMVRAMLIQQKDGSLSPAPQGPNEAAQALLKMLFPPEVI